MNRLARHFNPLLRTFGTRWMHNDALSLNVKRGPVKAKRWQPWKSPWTWMLAVVPPFTFGLGTWQVQRLRWKNDLVRQADEQLEKQPVVLPTHIDIANLQPYRRVITQGVWLHTHSLLVGPRKYESFNGYHLFTPLARSSSNLPNASTIWVNRGFISDAIAASMGKDPTKLSMMANAGDGTVQVMGMFSPPFVSNAFTPENKRDANEWVWADLTALVERAGGEAKGVEPVLIETTFEGDVVEASSMIASGKPVGRYPAVIFRNQHASYAITWYSLSLGTALLLLRLIRKQPPKSAVVLNNYPLSATCGVGQPKAKHPDFGLCTDTQQSLNGGFILEHTAHKALTVWFIE